MRRCAVPRSEIAVTSFHVGLVATGPLGPALDWVARAEALGFDGVWAADSQSIFRDPFIALAAIAQRTSSIRLATGVTNPVTRHPAVLANAFATLDELSGGRATLGIGVGASTVRTLGRDPARLADLEDVIRTIRELLAGRETDWKGTRISMPWSERSIPVVISSSGPRSLRLAGRVADGVLFQVGTHPDLVEWAISNVRDGAAEAGRDPDGVETLMRLGCVVSDDDAAAREAVKGYAAAAAVTVAFSIPRSVVPEEIHGDLGALEAGYDWYGHARGEARHVDLLSERLLDAVTVTGSAESVASRLKDLVGLGVDGFVIPILGADPVEQTTAIAERVAPAVRG